MFIRTYYQNICSCNIYIFKAIFFCIFKRSLIFDVRHARVIFVILYRGNPTITSVSKDEKNTRRFERDLLCDVPRGSFFHGMGSNENKISLTFLSSSLRDHSRYVTPVKLDLVFLKERNLFI